MPYRIKLELNAEEYNGLLDLAILELRSLPDQARYLIRKALTTTTPQEENTQKSEKTVSETT